MTWGIRKLREGTGYQNRRPRLCSDLWSVCVVFGSWEQKITHPLFLLGSLPSPIFPAWCCVIPSLPLTLLFTTGIQVFGFGVLLVVLRGARCTFVLLSGPVWAFGGGRGGTTLAKRTGTVLLSCCIPVKEAYGKEGVWQGVGWTRVELGLACDRRLPPLFSCLVPLCPASGGAAGQTNAPA